jgi:hypothetical protein
MSKGTCAILGWLLLVSCGGEANGVGALCARSFSKPGYSANIVTCASGLSCCVGPPDTGGTCEAPDGGNPCPSGGNPQHNN